MELRSKPQTLPPAAPQWAISSSRTGEPNVHKEALQVSFREVKQDAYGISMLKSIPETIDAQTHNMFASHHQCVRLCVYVLPPFHQQLMVNRYSIEVWP
ncbi:uncharacterized protein YALI1_B22391g [Yarrowia lipolytica]|uniref:Uncharacterized protein n=1 Tax=Yarrowia lipolytica TaxID=4952 RepID=A0A1D8N862_YARLL|nr:hypothetical protein YALI1_B22391g [Yarrowia lipolytica]